MEDKTAQLTEKEQILNAFLRLRTEREKAEAKITTKQEEARKAEDEQIVEIASSYTVEKIVKDLADLQLDFGNTIEATSGNLLVRINKLDELRRAIHVETTHLEELRNIRIAADALSILIRENEEKMKKFDEGSEQQRQALQKEISDAKESWQREQRVFEVEGKEKQKARKKMREKEEAEFLYNQEQKRKFDADEYENKKRTLEQKLAEEREELQENWAQREKFIEEKQEEFEDFKAKIETFSKTIEKATQKARDETIKENEQKSQIEAELSEKECAANNEVFTLKIKSLEEAIEKQMVENEKLTTQLQAALQQVQKLAVRTVESTGKTGKSVTSEEK